MDVIEIIQHLTSKTLSPADVTLVNNFIVANKKYMVGLSSETIATEFIKWREKRARTTDTSSLSVTLRSILSMKSIDDVADELIPKLKLKHIILNLDTRYAEFLENNTKLKWDLALTLTDEFDSSVNIKEIFGNIRSIKLSSFVLNQFTSTQQRAAILIEELSAQAFVLPNRNKFHFVTLLKDLSEQIYSGPIPLFSRYNKYELVPKYACNDGKYFFNDVINLYNSITLRILDPFDFLNIPRYQNDGVTIAFTSPTTGTLTFPFEHYYTGTIYSAFIDDFSTDQPVADASFISFVNSLEHTNITVTSTTEMTIDFEHARKFPGATPVLVVPAFIGAPQPFTIRFNGSRSIINLDIEFLTNE